MEQRPPTPATVPALDPDQALRFALAQYKAALERGDRFEKAVNDHLTTIATLTDEVSDLRDRVARVYGEHDTAKHQLVEANKEIEQLKQSSKHLAGPVSETTTKEFTALFGAGQ